MEGLANTQIAPPQPGARHGRALKGDRPPPLDEEDDGSAAALLDPSTAAASGRRPQRACALSVTDPAEGTGASGDPENETDTLNPIPLDCRPEPRRNQNQKRK